MPIRGIRGATVVDADRPDLILHATRELLETIARENDLAADDVASIIFTMTPDLKTEYPARAARAMGWTQVALLGATEMEVPGGLPRCIRVLLHVNTNRPPSAIKHIYLHKSSTLRPDQT